jgi:glutathione S-transferase
MLKLYGFARVNKGARGNTRDLRVVWALEEMGLSHEIVGMDHPNHDLDSPAVLDAGTHQEMLKPFPNLLAYRARCTQRPAWKKTVDAYQARVEAA